MKMRRSVLRETIFRLLFLSQFTDEKEREEQVRRYLDLPRDSYDEAGYEEIPEKDDRAYIESKVDAVLEKLPEIDALLNESSKGWKTSRMNKADLSVLRLAVYEIKYDDEIPTGVAINEAVELAKKYGGEESAPFVNGILGTIAGPAEK